MHQQKTEQQNNNIEQIKEFVSSDLEKLDGLLRGAIDGASNLTSEISNNIFSSGGKRIRPVLTILTGKAFGYEQEELYHLAAAVELIHTATLLHDDVIDESNQRRGKETANNIHGNKASILVGDVLFAESFKAMVKTGSMDALNILAKASSVIAEGEVKQLELKKEKDFSKEKYFEVIEAKTAALFAASTESSACLAGKSGSVSKIAKDFGLNLGLAFQIIDDVLDYKADSKKLGKNLGDDFFEQKITLPIILLHKNSPPDDRQEIERLFNVANPTKDDLNHLLSMMEHKNIYAYCFDLAKEYMNEALLNLKSFPISKYKDVLQAVCYAAISRSY